MQHIYDRLATARKLDGGWAAHYAADIGSVLDGTANAAALDQRMSQARGSRYTSKWATFYIEDIEELIALTV